MQIVNARLILPDSILPGSLSVKDGKISAISREKNSKGAKSLDLKGGFLAPGFIDLHVHGAVGHDTMEATEEAFRNITEFHLRGGTTSITLTSLTAAEEDIIRVLDLAKKWHGKSLGGSRIAGVHVEGPFISRAKAGAQDPQYIRDPEIREWKRYLKYGSLITEMTVAPEIPGALPLIKALRKNGSIASGGHTDAYEPLLHKAVEAGLNHATHTFNAMSGVRKDGAFRTPGMIEFALAHDAITCELIADGVHVPPMMMRLLHRAKGADKICIITDATSGAGLAPGTTFKLVSIVAKVTKETAVLMDGSGLAGSTLSMIEAVRRTVQLAGIDLVDAVKMASLTPARQLGKEKEIGSLEKGKRADLVWFNENFQVCGVWLDGDLRFLA